MGREVVLLVHLPTIAVSAHTLSPDLLVNHWREVTEGLRFRETPALPPLPQGTPKNPGRTTARETLKRTSVGQRDTSMWTGRTPGADLGSPRHKNADAGVKRRKKEDRVKPTLLTTHNQRIMSRIWSIEPDARRCAANGLWLQAEKARAGAKRDRKSARLRSLQSQWSQPSQSS